MPDRRSSAQVEVDEDAPTREFVRPSAGVGVEAASVSIYAQSNVGGSAQNARPARQRGERPSHLPKARSVLPIVRFVRVAGGVSPGPPSRGASETCCLEGRVTPLTVGNVTSNQEEHSRCPDAPSQSYLHCFPRCSLPAREREAAIAAAVVRARAARPRAAGRASPARGANPRPAVSPRRAGPVAAPPERGASPRA